MTWHWEDSHRALWQTEPMAFEALQEVFRFCLSVETLQETDWRKAWSCRPETEIPGGKKGKYSEFHREPVETLCLFYFLGQSESPWKRYARLGDLSYGGKAWGCFANLFKQRFCHLKMLWVWVVWISAFGLQWAPTGAHDFFRHFNRSGEVDFTKSTEEIGRSEQENVERSRGARNPVGIGTFEGKTVKTRCKMLFLCEIQFFGSTSSASWPGAACDAWLCQRATDVAIHLRSTSYWRPDTFPLWKSEVSTFAAAWASSCLSLAALKRCLRDGFWFRSNESHHPILCQILVLAGWIDIS